LQGLGLGTPDQVLDRYGETRADWQPFGEDSIRILLQAMQDDINDRLPPGATRIRWTYADEASFWDVSAAEARRNVRRLEHDPCLIVLDPLAFCDPDVKTRFDNALRGAMRNANAFVLVLAPVNVPPALLLRRQLEEVAFAVFESFYEPPMDPTARYANAALHVADRQDLLGWLYRAVRPVLSAPAQTARSPFTSIA
jgi:hypothetical protein